MPETPVDRFLEPVRHFDERGGIGRRDEGPDRLVIQEGAEQLIEVMRTHGIRRRCESEQVVECRRHLESALVSVAHHTGDPARIGGPATHHPRHLVREAADDDMLGPGTVGVIDRRRLARQRLDGSRRPPHELVVIIAVENVVLAVVLRLDDGLAARQAMGEDVGNLMTLLASAIGETTPGEIGPREIVPARPAFLVDQGL